MKGREWRQSKTSRGECSLVLLNALGVPRPHLLLFHSLLLFNGLFPLKEVAIRSILSLHIFREQDPDGNLSALRA